MLSTARTIFLSGLLILTLSGCQSLQTRQAEPATPQPAIAATSVAPPADVVTVSELCIPQHDLWARIRSGLQLSGHEQRLITIEQKWFQTHQTYINRSVNRARPSLHLIVEAVEQRGLPMEIALLPFIESAFQPFAYSHGRAAGIWQFIPGTARRFGLQINWWYDGRRDLFASTKAALDYLEYLGRFFDGDWLLALAAYNSGEGTVRKAVRKNRKRGKATDFWALKLPLETRTYVPRLLALANVIASPASNHITLPTIEDSPFLEQVALDSQIDLALAAKLAHLEVADLYLYNPGFNRWATPPKGPHALLLPRYNAALFQINIAEHPPKSRLKWVRHRIKPGESIGTIAQRYHTSAALLREINRLKGSTIRAGRYLNVPVASKSPTEYRNSADNRLNRIKSSAKGDTRLDYRVQRGDTLWDIAMSHGVTVRRLAKWNGMAPGDTLKPKSQLVIWKNTVDKVSGLQPASFNHPHAESARQRIGYRVRKGDSLSGISHRFGVSVRDLKRWNRLNEKRYLQPGQRLTLYVDVTRQTGI